MRRVRNQKRDVNTWVTRLRALLIASSLIAAAVADADPVRLIEQAARRHNIDPNLAVAIATVESGLDHTAVGGLGELGLFQLRPEFHGQHVTMQAHIEYAVGYLAYTRKRCAARYGAYWYICFNTGPYRKKTIDKPADFYYAKRVSAVYAYLTASAVQTRVPHQPQKALTDKQPTPLRAPSFTERAIADATRRWN